MRFASPFAVRSSISVMLYIYAAKLRFLFHISKRFYKLFSKLFFKLLQFLSLLTGIYSNKASMRSMMLLSN